MDDITTRPTTSVTTSVIQQSFLWMFFGLLVSAAISLFVASTPSLVDAIFSNSVIFFGLIIAELAVVFFLSFRITKMSFGAALVSYFAYAILNGVTLSVIILAYTPTSLATTFLVAALVFGVMAAYGYTTHHDLTTIGNLAIMALIGVIIASVVNLFLKNDTFSYILSYLGVIIFVGLTAYDTQKIKNMTGMAASENLGVLGALTLYLDFINLFLSLLRIMGKQRD